MKLLLFDIDGTLLRVSPSGRRILGDALSTLMDRPIITDGVRFSGRTDLPIIRDVLIRSGCSSIQAEQILPEALRLYRELGKTFLDGPDSVRVLPGVKSLLDTLLDRDDVVLGLLTGNVKDMAYAKLRAGGLDHYFPFGAFGSDHESRDSLPRVALDHARTHAGHEFKGKDIVIIGDTEFDVLCGRKMGVFAVAVATGRFDRSYLAAYEPDLLLDDLRNLEWFLRAVLES